MKTKFNLKNATIFFSRLIIITYLLMCFNASAQYCTPPTSTNYNCCSMYISNVTTTGGITNFNNSTGAEAASYGNYSASDSASQNAGSAATITVTSHSYYMDFNIYVDYNDNGVFTDAGELVLQIATTASLAPVSGTFTVPASALAGTHRMRVRAEYGGSGYPTSPCSQLQYGETEDYGLTVLPPQPCSGTPAPGNTLISSSSCSSVCSGVNFTMSLQNFTSGSGVTYQWYSSPNNTTYTAISGATAATYTTSQTTETWYECVVTCTNSSNSATSTPLDVVMGSLAQCAAYCLPTFYSTSASTCTYINSVTTSGGLTNITTAVDTGFTGNVAYGMNYYSCAVVSQYAGASFTLNMQCQGACNIAYMNVWVDWNQDGVFQSSEQVINNVSTGDTARSFTINIPSSAVIGPTRMRIVDFGGGYVIGPCDNLTSYYSEGEDYVLDVILFAGINELTSGNAFSVYPNPLTSSSTLQLNTQVTDAEVAIYDMVGKELMRNKLTGNRMEIEKGSLVSGVYFVKLTGEGRQWVEKLVVE